MIQRKQAARSGLSLIEMTVVVMITAIVFAAVVPKWSDFRAEVSLASASAAFSADVQAIRRHAMRSGQTFELAVTVGDSFMTVTPAIPKLIGSTSGVVEYDIRYPGFVFSSSPFSGESVVDVDIRGDLISRTTGQPMSDASGSISIGDTSISVSL